MRLLLVARKSLLEYLRELQLLGLTLAAPVIFVAITALTYSYPLLTTYPTLVTVTDPNGEPLANEIGAQRYPDGRAVFDVRRVEDREQAMEALKTGDAAALLVIGRADQTAHDGGAAGTGNPPITVVGDALSARFYRASALLDGLTTRYLDRLTGRPQPVRIADQPLAAAGPENEFDVYAPGMIIFALLMIIPQTAMLVAREIRWRTLRRLQITRLTAWELLGGIGLAQMVVAVVQVALVLLTALVFGFHLRGSWWLAVVVGLAISLSAVGLGLVVACFVENDSQAANVGASVGMLQVFLSGAFYQLRPITLFTLAGHQIDLFDVLPASHAFSALQQVLTYGAKLDQIGFRLGATLFLSALCLAAGILIFQRRQMKSS